MGLLDIFSGGDVIKAVGNIVEDYFPSEAEKGKMILQQQQMELEALKLDNALEQGQIATNTAEASNPHIFVAGWRPFVGWVGGMALAYQFILYPFLTWFWTLGQSMEWISKTVSCPPMLDTSALMALITGMLGIGGMRSFEKLKSVETTGVSITKK
jgi:hypothetical protein